MSDGPKLQFCSGEHGKLDGWLNFDRDVDIAKPLPFPDNYAAKIFCEHGLEHVSPQDGLRFLMECHRILKPGGTIRICVPDIELLPRVLPEEKLRDLVFNHEHKAAYNKNLLYTFLVMAGFGSLRVTLRHDATDRHWTCIGKEQDDMETLRMEAFK